MTDETPEPSQASTAETPHQPPPQIRIPGPKTPLPGRGWRFQRDLSDTVRAKGSNVFSMLAFVYRDRQAVTTIEAGPEGVIEWHVSARRNTVVKRRNASPLYVAGLLTDAEFQRVLADFELTDATESPYERDPAIRHAVARVPESLITREGLLAPADAT